jgi:hypothetical protein
VAFKQAFNDQLKDLDKASARTAIILYLVVALKNKP